MIQAKKEKGGKHVKLKALIDLNRHLSKDDMQIAKAQENMLSITNH